MGKAELSLGPGQKTASYTSGQGHRFALGKETQRLALYGRSPYRDRAPGKPDAAMAPGEPQEKKNEKGTDLGSPKFGDGFELLEEEDWDPSGESEQEWDKGMP